MMKVVDDTEPDAVVWVGDLGFPVWFSEEGVRRLGLPELNSGMTPGRYATAAVRIDIEEEPGDEDTECLERLALFLVSVVRGEEPPGLPPVDLGSVTPFTREVLEAVAGIPRGECRSYAWVARNVERPLAARAIGGAVGRNPVPLLVPCHRVVRTDGTIGGWSGSPGWKEFLLDSEKCR